MGDREAADMARAWPTCDHDAGRSADERARLGRQLSQIRDRVLAGATLCPGQDVLDLGAGTGLLASAALTEVAPDGRVIAVDRSRAALAEISVAGWSRLHRIVGDAHRIPLACCSVDAVLTRSVLIYVDDLVAALGEIARVLRPGGRLSVCEPINSRRRHNADLVGITAEQLAAIDVLRVRSSTAAPTMAFDENRLTSAVIGAGLTMASLHVEQVTDRLGDHDTVDAYLHRRPHPGAPTPVELVTAKLGPVAAAGYAAAWHHALDEAAPRGGITFSTAVLYLTAVLPRPAPRAPSAG
jgi:arsenite methyltransferase